MNGSELQAIDEVRTEFLGLYMEGKRRPELDSSQVLTYDLQETLILPRNILNYPSEKDVDTSIERLEVVSPLERTGEMSFIHIVQTQQEKSKPSDDFILIIRNNFVSPIINSLKKVQVFAKTPDAAVYIDEILHAIREMETKSPQDPFLEILFAFYDSIAHEGLWATYSAQQFAEVEKMLSAILEKLPLKEEIIEKTIIQLEENGFDTTPYTVNLTDETS